MDPRISSTSSLLAALILWAGSNLGHADVTATYGAQGTGSPLADPNGAYLNIGALVRLGFFDNSVDFSTMNTSLTTLDTHFTELAHIQVGFFDGSTIYNSSGAFVSRSDGVNSGQRGYFGGTVQLNPLVNGVDNSRLYIWAFDTDSLNTATAQAILSDDAWRLGTFGPVIFDLNTVDPLDKNDFYYALKRTETSVPLGPDADPVIVNKLIALPVPEPSLATSSLLGLMALVKRRRLLP